MRDAEKVGKGGRKAHTLDRVSFSERARASRSSRVSVLALASFEAASSLLCDTQREIQYS